MVFFQCPRPETSRALLGVACILAAMQLMGGGDVTAAVTTFTYEVPPAWIFFFGFSPPVDLLAGDTLEIQVHFQDAWRLSLTDAPAPDPTSPKAAITSILSAGSGGPATAEFELLGVSGSLSANPIILNITCSDGACGEYTPDLTDTSFDSHGFVLRLTPQFAASVAVAQVYFLWPEGGSLTTGPGLVDPPQTIPALTVPLEYSNDPDEAVEESAGTSQEVHGAPDPGQTLYTEPVDVDGNLLPGNGLDFFPASETGVDPRQQVDALAYGSDAYLSDLFNDKADLLFSVERDGAEREWALLREETDGMVSVEYFHRDLVSQDGPGGLDDLDAAELWGDPGALDAHYYSLRGDAGSGTSVFVDLGGGLSIPFVSHAEVLAAAGSLGYVGEPDQIDVDGMMVRNAGVETRFEEGDVLLFSVRATPNGNFDGGEIIELRPGEPAKFFEHGGHVWDTAFDLLALLNPLNGGVDPDAGEDVDALEATLASWAVGLVTGRVPDGGGPEPPLTVVREPSGDLTLSWGVSCAPDDTDYEIYAGFLGGYYSHVPVACSTAGMTSLTIPPPPESRYYLVVPTNGFDEGSYGLHSNGVERPQGFGFCRPSAPVSCGP